MWITSHCFHASKTHIHSYRWHSRYHSFAFRKAEHIISSKSRFRFLHYHNTFAYILYIWKRETKLKISTAWMLIYSVHLCVIIKGHDSWSYWNFDQMYPYCLIYWRQERTVTYIAYIDEFISILWNENN